MALRPITAALFFITTAAVLGIAAIAFLRESTSATIAVVSASIAYILIGVAYLISHFRAKTTTEASLHIAYWKMLNRIGDATAKGHDPGPAIDTLCAMLSPYHDPEFVKEWEALRARQSRDDQSEEKLSIWEIRAMELASLVRLMRRKNMIEEIRGMDPINPSEA